MAISTTAATRRTVDDVVLLAYKTVGRIPKELQASQVPNWGELSEYGRQMLDSILDSLVAMGAEARLVKFVEVTFTAGTYKYALDSSIVDVVGDAVYLAASETDTSKASAETPIKQISRDDWHTLSNKDASGQPFQFMAYRGEADYTIELRFWPIPDEAGTARIQARRAPADALVGADSIDMREYWMQALIWELTAQLAPGEGLTVERCSFFAKRAQDKLAIARQFGNQTVDDPGRLDHPTAWS